MWKYLLLLFLLFDSCEEEFTIRQNLIANPSFEVCGRPTVKGWILNDTSNAFLVRESPPFGGLHSLQLLQGWIGGSATTYISGQSGTGLYKLNLWMKSPSGSGHKALISMGIISQGEFVENKNHLIEVSSVWESYSILDTLTTQYNDSIRIWLWGGYSQFGGIETLYDLVELTKVEYP